MTGESRKAFLREALTATREQTLRLLDRVPEAFLRTRVHEFYSPVGWHFGHIGMTEEFWVCREASGVPPLDDRLSFLFANLPENPKEGRGELPSRAEIKDYLARTRQRTLATLETAHFDAAKPLLSGGYAWEFARQHECQHQETIAELLQLIHQTMGTGPDSPAGRVWSTSAAASAETEMISVPGGTFLMGSDDPGGYDNEKRAHPVTVAPFALDKTPVTARQWTIFLDDGGCRRPQLWTPEGWAWRCRENTLHPEYWKPGERGGFLYYGIGGLRPLHPDEPVSAVSWYEADAYARWAGKRLPTEAEWEYAAAFAPETGRRRHWPWGDPVAVCREPSADAETYADQGLRGDGPLPVGSRPRGTSALGLQDMAGGVWEWTASPFLPYPGFEAFPYDGYSKDHMDAAHFVCRGGSWATAESILRCSFRNWYVPTYRQGFLGLRCAAGTR
ncbi:MAG: ergothioneine biosynthesis protein EgtB [Cytophagales bacterium]|nr:ergothioneine biosynthesis protein EgtB [Armatimonadota bacterium]